MSSHNLPPAPGLPPDRAPAPKGGPATSGAGGVPPGQPQSAATPPKEGPRAESKVDVDHGPAVPGKRDGQPDVGAGAPPRTEDRPGSGAVGIPKEVHFRGGDTIRFDWYQNSAAQVVSLNTSGKRRFIDSITGIVKSPSIGHGPTTLVLRKVPAGQSLSTGVALHTGSIDLIGPRNQDISGVEQIMSMAPEEDRFLEEGDCIAADFSGGMADAQGTVMIKMAAR